MTGQGPSQMFPILFAREVDYLEQCQIKLSLAHGQYSVSPIKCNSNLRSTKQNNKKKSNWNGIEDIRTDS